MKIDKRSLASPTGTASLFLTPLSVYIVGKAIGTEYNQFEFLHWIVISLTFTIWFFLNYKITK